MERLIFLKAMFGSERLSQVFKRASVFLQVGINFDKSLGWSPEKIKDSQNTASGEEGGQNGTT